MASALLRLVMLLAVLVMPAGMAAASAPVQPAAAAAHGHCDDDSKPADTPSKPALHCAACAALPAIDLPAVASPPQLEPALDASAVRWTSEPGPETDTPPPRLR